MSGKDESFEVDGNNFASHIRRIITRLYKILSATWTDDDSRKVPAIKLLEEAVWNGVYAWVDADADVITLDGNRLMHIMKGIEGRVKTRIEGFFPEGQQCEALKSLANQAIWASHKPIRDQETEMSSLWDL